MKCPKCRGMLHYERGAFNVAEHVKCMNCGAYWERPLAVIMPSVPVVETRFRYRPAVPRTPFMDAGAMI